MKKEKHNPAEIGLTQPQYDAYKLLEKRQNKGLITTSGDIAKVLKKDRSNTYRALRVLIDLGLVERYTRRCYRII